MVNAETLSDYEMWVFISSMLFSAIVGFLTSFLPSLGDESGPAWELFWLIILMSVLLAGSALMALRKRKALTSETVDVAFKATDAGP